MRYSRSILSAAAAANTLLLLFAQSQALAGPDPGGGRWLSGAHDPDPFLAVDIPPAARLAVGLLAILGVVRLLRRRGDEPPPRS